MLRRLIVFDLALLVLLGFGAIRLRASWLAFGPVHAVAAIRPAAEPVATLPAQVVKASVPENWMDIPTRNPFSFDRSDIDVLAPVEIAAPKPAAPKPLLFGVMFFDNQRVAMLGSGQPQAGNRALRSLKVGEAIDGWSVVSIDSKTAVVELNGAKETLIMNDPTAQVPREVVRTVAVPAAAQVTTQQPASMAPTAGNPAAPNAPAQLPPGTKTRTVQTPFGTRTFIDPIP